MLITISTCIDRNILQKIKKEGWKVPELIRLGVKDREGGFKVLMRLNELERENLKLLEEIARLKLHSKMLYKEMRAK